MAQFTDLTLPQQELLRTFMLTFRQGVGQIAQALNRLDKMHSIYDAAIAPMIAALDDGAEIPDMNPGSGAAPLTKNDVATVIGQIEQVLAGFNAPINRAHYIGIAGLNATMA